MKKLLNTLYVTTPLSYISKDGSNIVVSVEQQEVFRIPALNVENIVTFGYMGVSPGLMKLCVENNIGIVFLTPGGKFISRVSGPSRGNVLLRKSQYLLSDNSSACLDLDRIFIAAKVQNSRTVLMRHVRDHGESESIRSIETDLKDLKGKILQSSSVQELMALEGVAANKYFSVFSEMIIQQRSDFRFSVRSKRPPKDPVNIMLSFAYTLLANEMASALETVGLDPYIGFMHSIRPGRNSLALDLIEELRAYMCDRLVLSLINKRQIQAEDFYSQGEDIVLMTEKGRKILLSAWQMKKKETITHPYLNEKIELGLLPYVQSLLLARYIRGQIDAYPAFIYR